MTFRNAIAWPRRKELCSSWPGIPCWTWLEPTVAPNAILKATLAAMVNDISNHCRWRADQL